MKLHKSEINCGIYQLNGLADAYSIAGCKEMIKKIKKSLLAKEVCKTAGWMYAHARPPVIIFSDRSPGAAELFVKHIEENGYGTVTASKTFVNSSVSDQDCKLYMWLLDYKGLGLTKLLKSYR